jgi:hypothetical protein
MYFKFFFNIASGEGTCYHISVQVNRFSKPANQSGGNAAKTKTSDPAGSMRIAEERGISGKHPDQRRFVRVPGEPSWEALRRF